MLDKWEGFNRIIRKQTFTSINPIGGIQMERFYMMNIIETTCELEIEMTPSMDDLYDWFDSFFDRLYDSLAFSVQLTSS